MTIQECDRFIYNNDTFGIVGVDGEGLFNPADYGIKVIPISNACWRGYYCVYSILNNSLYLQEAYLGLDKEDERLIQKGNGIKLFGQTPHRYKYLDGKIIKIDARKNLRKTKKANYSWDFRCDNLNQLIDFTGGILIGSDSLGRINISLPNCSKAYELVFDAGELIEFIDCTNKMSEFEKLLNSEKSELDTNEKWQAVDKHLKHCFSWDYKL